MHVERTVDVW